MIEVQLKPSCSIIETQIKDEVYKLRVWGDIDSPKRGIALLVHGLGAHSAWFEAAARQLAERGFLVLAYDQRGFGSRTDLELKSYKEWLADLAEIIAYIKKTYANAPVYVMGNSMGALVVMATKCIEKCKGIVIFSPGFDGHPETFPLSYKVKSVVSAFLNPKRRVALPYHFDRVTRDIGVRNWLETDDLKQLSVPGSMLFELLKLSQNVIANLRKVHVPVLMITAGFEKVVNNEVSAKLFARMEAPLKKHVHMAEAWHDLMFDPQVDEVADAIVAWQSELESLNQRNSSGACC